MTITELRDKRNKAWEAAKAFVETKRDADGLMTAEDAATYAQMEQKVQDYSTEIDRMERQEAMDRQLNAPTSTPITGKPAKCPKGDRVVAQVIGREGDLLDNIYNVPR